MTSGYLLEYQLIYKFGVFHILGQNNYIINLTTAHMNSYSKINGTSNSILQLIKLNEHDK